jgi:cytochrome P450
VGGYLIPKGATAVMCHHTMSNSEDYISNPKSFCPERWIKSSDKYVSFAMFLFINI